MITRLSEILSAAKEGHYGVPALSSVNEMTCRAAIKAAEDVRSPLILLEGLIYDGGLSSFLAHQVGLCEEAKVPVAIIRDHAGTMEESLIGVRAGFDSVMIDMSKLPYEQNRTKVAEFVYVAHACGVEVEAELGHVGAGSEDQSVLTVPDEAARYVDETGVDFLAVAIGTSHGIYQGTPRIDFELLDELLEAISVPLVLHGASGTGDDNIARCCRQGICKVNVATDLFIAARDAAQRTDLSGKNVYGIYDSICAGFAAEASRWMRLCGSAGRC